MKRMLLVGVLLGVILGGVARLRPAAAQAAQPGVQSQTNASSAALEDLLVEVRALRADLARSASVSVRVQILTGRLSVQEQRLNELGRQFAAVRVRADDVSSRRGVTEALVRQWEANLARLPQEQQRDVEQALPARRAEAESLQESEERIRLELSDLTNEISAQQNQWNDINNRLDALERSLP